MITQQVAAYLIKKMQAAIKKPDGKAEDKTDELFKHYLSTKGRRAPADVISNGIIDNEAIVEAFRWRAADLSYRAYHERVVKKKNWNSLLIQLHKLSNAYSQKLLVENFHTALQESTLPKETATVVSHLYQLYALYTMDEDSRSFVTTNAVTSASLDELQDAILVLMTEKIRPHAVKLVDSWAMPDYLLDSALGRSDGKVYEDLWDRAHRQNPLNKVTFNVDWESDEIVKGSSDGGRHILAKL
jgi:acyl-CoA oxidase